MYGEWRTDRLGRQRALGARHIATAGIMLGRGVERARQCFKECFRFVMIVASVEDFRVQIHAGVDGETFKEMKEEIRAELPQGRGDKISFKDTVGPATQINSDKCQCLIHRHKAVCGAGNALAGAQGLVNRFAETDHDIFRRVMIINVQIPVGLYIDIEKAVAGKKGQHMIEKADAGIHLGAACPVEINGNGDFCFFGLALDLRLACRQCRFHRLHDTERPLMCQFCFHTEAAYSYVYGNIQLRIHSIRFVE